MEEAKEGELVGAGPFGLDKDAQQRKLGANQMKIWKHRTAVVWEEFGDEFLSLCGYSSVMGLLLFSNISDYLIRDDAPRAVAFIVWPILGAMASYFLRPIFLFIKKVIGILFASVLNDLNKRLDRVKSKWTKDSISEKVEEHSFVIDEEPVNHKEFIE